MLDAKELSYAAGIIDGEGYIGILRVNRKLGDYPRYELRVNVTMCNSLIPSWLHANFGGSYYEFQPPSLKHKKRYEWRLATWKAGEFLKLILPYLKMKQGEAQIGIAFQSYRKEKYVKCKPKPIAVIKAEAILHQKLKELHERQYQPGEVCQS